MEGQLTALKSQVLSFITPAGEGLPSPMAQIGDIYADNLAGKINSSIQAAIRGSSGGTMKAVTGALEEEAIAANPIMAALPKKLLKNPAAAAGLQMVIQRAMENAGQGSGPARGSNGDYQKPRFNFNV